MGLTEDRAELNIDGTWIDITSDVYERDPISISRGRADQGTQSDPGKCTLTLDNRLGKYSPRNPESPYYGSLGRNTPLRVSVPAGAPYLSVDGETPGTVYTPDDPSLDLAGSFSIVADLEIEWYASAAQGLVGKWGTSDDDKSFLMWLHFGSVRLSYADSEGGEWWATVPLPRDLPRRAVLRAVLAVSAVSDNRSVLFGWSDSITGPFTGIGPILTDSGAITLRSGSAPLQVGSGGNTILGDVGPLRGRVHEVRVQNSLTGVDVATPNFSAQPADTTNFVDSAGRPWVVQSPAEIRGRTDRFVGEVSTWAVRWDLSSTDRWVNVEANGILRRMGQGARPIDSALRRSIPISPSLLAYWPLEDGPGTTSAGSPLPGVGPMKLLQVDWAASTDLPSSNPLPTLASHSGVLPEMYGRVPAPSTPSSEWSVHWLFRMDSAPTGGPWTFMRILTTGTVQDLYIRSNDSGSSILGLGEGTDGSAVNIINQTGIQTGSRIFGQWILGSFRMTQSGSTVTWRADWTDIDGNFIFWTNSFTGNIGRVTRIVSPPDGFGSALDGMALGHISVFSAATTDAYDGAITGYSGETALNRLTRLSAEESLPLTAIDGDLTIDSSAVGPQRPKSLLDLLSECADADSGLLFEDRERLGLFYRDRTSMYNQLPRLTLNYSAGEVWPPFEPVDDDTDLANDVTVSRDGGASARAVLDEGPLSVRSVGSYTDSVTLNLDTDEQAAPAAYWRMHLGTVDEARYPSVTVLLHAAPHLAPSVLTVREGDKIAINGLPDWVSANDVELLVSGYSETITTDTWVVTFNCVPASPWNVGTVSDFDYGRADAEGSVLAENATTSETTFAVTTAGNPWIDSTSFPLEFPIDLTVGGEVVRVTAIDPPVSGAQAFTVIRSRNGVVKAQTAGTSINFFTPTVVAL